MQNEKNLTVSDPQTPPSRSILTYLIWIVGALILVIGVMIIWSVVSEPAAPRTSAERDLAQYEDLVKEQPQNAAARAGMGAALVQAGAYQRAVEQLNTAIKLGARPEYYVVLAEARVGLGDTKSAISALKKAQNMNESYGSAWYAEGKIYFDEGEYAKAIGPFNRTLGLEPSASDVNYLLGQSLEKLGKREAAIDAYRKAIKYLPDYAEAIDALEALGVKAEPQTTGDGH